MTYQQLRDLIVHDYEINQQRLGALKSRLTHLDAAMPLTAAEIQTYTAARLKAGAAPGSVNQELAILRRMFNLGLRFGIVSDKPWIGMLRVRNARKGFFEADQYKAVIGHLSETYRPVVTVLYLTGWRSQEVLSRQKKHLDLASGWLRLEPGETKNGDGREFPLTRQLRECLTTQLASVRDFERRTGRIVPWLFHRNGGRIVGFRKAWESACKDAGVPGRLLHDFRRTAVRNLERAGVSRSAAMAMVGHKTEAIYRRYAIVDQQVLKEAAAKLDAI